MESLSKQVLEANERHKNALDQYSRKLREELNTVDKLIAAVENISDDNLQEDIGDKWCLHADGALKPNSIISRSQILNERSPFFAEALRKERYSKCLVPNSFSASEKQYLEKAVMKENKRLAASNAQRKGEDAFEEILRSDNNDIFLDNVEGLNWEYIARDVSASSNSVRTAQECKVRWVGQQHPKNNLKRWSKDEESSLHDLVESKRESGQVNWEEISSLLETNRTALNCIKHFQASTRSTFRWTDALDNKLREAVEKYGIGNWVLVSSSVSPHVSANQCQIRYERSLKPEIKRGRFTADEDELLMKAIEVHGTDWVKVAQAVPGRTNAQCRGRYTLNMSGGNAKEPWDAWDAEEDERLRAAVSKHGYQWDKVHEEMGATRPQAQYASRYSILTRSDVQDNECLDIPQAVASHHFVWRPNAGSRTRRANASQVIVMRCNASGSKTSAELSNVIGMNSEKSIGESESITVPVPSTGQLNTTHTTTGANRSRKRKVTPPIAEPDSQMDGGIDATQQLSVTKRRPKRQILPPVAEPDSQMDNAATQNQSGAKRGRKRKVPPSIAEADGHMDDGVKAAQTLNGAKRGRKRKVPPSVAEPDGQMGDELNAPQTLNGAKRRRTRKILPPITQPDGQTNGSNAKSDLRPEPNTPIVVSSNSDTNLDADLVSQSATDGQMESSRMSGPANIEQKMGISQTSPLTPDLSHHMAANLKDVEVASPKRTKATAKRSARQASQTRRESTSTHSMTTRASNRHKKA